MKTKTIVIKIGTSSITNDQGILNQDIIKTICNVTSKLKEQGNRVILVSSGAIGAGLSLLQKSKKPTDLHLKQAIAAIGQAKLIQTYQTYFQRNHQLCAQVLLTNDILSNIEQQKNVSHTLHTLHALEVIPVVNENDTVSTAEIDNIIFSDNDTLSAIVSILVDADTLVIFSDVNGLYEKQNNILSKSIIRYVDDINSVKKHVSNEKSNLGRGGMKSKLTAIEKATKNGIDVILTNINAISNIESILNDNSHGTFFKGGEKHGYNYNW